MGDRTDAAEAKWREARRELDQVEAAYRAHETTYVPIEEGPALSAKPEYNVESIEEFMLVVGLVDKAREREREAWFDILRAERDEHFEATEAARADAPEEV